MTKAFYILLIILFPLITFSQNIIVDSSYGTNGIKKFNIGNSNDNDCFNSVLQSNKNILIVGASFSSSGSNVNSLLYRIDSNSAYDNSFNNNGILIETNLPQSITTKSINLLNDKFLTTGNTNGKMYVRKYLKNGNLDSTFNSIGYTILNDRTYNTYGRNIALQSDNKIVVIGNNAINATTSNGLVYRLKADGQLDSTFGINGKVILNNGVQQTCKGFKIQHDDKIVVTGDLWGSYFIVRLLKNGGYDSTFNFSGVVMENSDSISDISDVDQQNDKKLVFFGSIRNKISTTDYSFKLISIRLNENGSRDVSFGQNGIVKFSSTGSSWLGRTGRVTQDSKIIIAGNYDNSANWGAWIGTVVVKLNINGTLDTTFVNKGIYKSEIDNSESNIPSSFLFLPNNEILLAGYEERPHVPFLIKFIDEKNKPITLSANFSNQRLTTLKDSIYATNNSTGKINQYQWYIKKSNIKTNLDTGLGNNHDLKYKLNTITSFDSLCLEVSNTSGQKSNKCKLLKLTSATISNSFDKNIANIYPNPTKGVFKIDLKSERTEKIQISINDIQGRKIYSLNQQDYYFKNKSIEIDLTEKVKKGVYFIQVITSNATINKQIIIE